MTTTEPTIRRGTAMRLSTSETTTAIDIGSIVLMTADEARAAADEIRGKLGDLRRTIHEFDSREGWRALNYDSFRSWAVAEIDQVGIRQVYRLLAAAEVESNLGVTIGHTPESHLRPLVQLDVDEQRAAWQLASEIAGDEPRQAAHVAAAVQHMRDPAAQLRSAIIGGPHRWLEAETFIANLPDGVRQDWQHDLDQVRGIDSSLRQRLAHSAASYVDSIRDGELRRMEEEITRGAMRELGLTWPAYHDNPVTPAPAPAPLVCNSCDQPALPNTALYSGQCTGCYHLRISAEPRDISQVRWNLKCAKDYTECLPGSDFRTTRLSQIDEMIADLAAPEQPLPPHLRDRVVTPDQVEYVREPEPEIDRVALLGRIEAHMATLLQRVRPEELRLLHALIVGTEDMWPDDDDSTAEELWEMTRIQLAEMTGANLRWIETSVSHS